jgi:Tol biopolymer transport system component
VYGLFNRRRMLVAAAMGAAAGTLLVAVAPSHATFRGANGRLLYQAQVGANIQLFTIKPDGTGVKQITHYKDRSATDANWGPGGSRIVFTQHWDPAGPNEHFILSTIDADGGDLRTLPKTGRFAVSANWLAGGRALVYLAASGDNGGRMMTVGADGRGMRSAGVSAIGPYSACALPDGKRVAFIGVKPGNPHITAIHVAGLYGRGLKRITPWGTYADKIDCSPDGTRIVFSKPGFSEGGRSSNVYTMKMDGTALVQLTHETGGEINAGADSWSPDGRKIAYVSNKSGTYQIWTMNADGSDAKQLTKAADAHLASWGSHP